MILLKSIIQKPANNFNLKTFEKVNHCHFKIKE